MGNDVEKSLNRGFDILRRDINNGFAALNKNLTDCAKSLRVLANATEETNRKKEDYWHPVFGDDGSIPGKEYDWVLVKIRGIGEDINFFGVPHIAMYLVNDGKWWPLEWEDFYGSKKVPFEVTHWKPIPGDICTNLYAGEKLIGRSHTYE